MDVAITRGFYKLYGKETPDGIMPMNIHHLGNSSVATIPTLLDMVLKNQIENHTLIKGDVILMASVGAGMNINAITYVVWYRYDSMKLYIKYMVSLRCKMMVKEELKNWV